ncbi:alpha/beta hydrolase [Rhodococcus sp. IEGM 1381]|uniref:alpha/beta fold hydrolase n=1 Tax=Rhodococcus sp. IEGM 1381 TaxID=3047085 RepID=UPI0024B74212|nr:alpha/beta hydrolase [Rhodococcus sp. IEGM 1381]MDI9897781.1 alpha/beta hydrolase [Rhodococcus sp. IEGM 1381]
MMSETVDLGGVDIAYRTFVPLEHPSAAPVPVMLVHGMGGDSGTWDRFARALTARGRRVITVDLRGHGKSAHTPTYEFDSFGGDLLALIDHLGLTEVDLVGHSLGGYAVSLVAQRRPSLVRRLVLEELPIPIRPGDAPPTLTGKLPSVTELWHAATSVVLHPRAVLAFDRSMTATALEQFRRPNPQWWESLADITAPTLVLRGGPGGMVDPVRLDAMVAEISTCRVEAFRTGHSIHRDGYSAFEATVLPFLTQ